MSLMATLNVEGRRSSSSRGAGEDARQPSAGFGGVGGKRALEVWLHSWADPLASLQCYSSKCMLFVDLAGDGDHKLVIADNRHRLKVYKGTYVFADIKLLGMPVGLASFYSSSSSSGGGELRTPSIAVASGPHVYILRNLKPYFKYSVPPVPADPQEVEIWRNLGASEVDVSEAVDALSRARREGVRLTTRSIELLSLTDEQQQADFARRFDGAKLQQQTVITCMDTIKTRSEEEDSPSILVLGTEAGQLLFVPPPVTTTQILCSVDLPGVPALLAPSGLFDMDWRVVVACRNGRLYTVKMGDVRNTAVVTGTVIDMETQPCAMLRLQRSILVGSTDNKVHSYHIKGKKNFDIAMPAKITTMAPLITRENKLLLVALGNATVRVYNGKQVMYDIPVADQVVSMRFGNFAREEHSLVLVTKSGGLVVKALNRRASLEANSAEPGPPPEQDIPLSVPRKTKLYVETTQREVAHSLEMHRLFQRDLCKLRLSTAEAYVKLITAGAMGAATHNPSSGAPASIRLHAECHGLGPNFRILLKVQNAGPRTLSNLPIALLFKPELYSAPCAQLVVPTLLPGLLNKLEVDITSVEETGAAGRVQVVVLNPDTSSAVPLVSATVSMPPSELREE